MKLATSWYISQDFVQHFPASTELQLFLSEYLIRVVRLCQKALVFSKKSPALLLAASLFSSFDVEFLPIQQELDQWGLLIEKKFSSLVTRSTLDGQAAGAKLGRSLTRLVSNKSRHHMRMEKQQRLLDRLSPDQDCFESIWRRERKRGTSSWILGTAHFKEWKSNASGSILRVTGCLGSGKTVALANAVADISLEKGTCAFFFCKGDDKRTLTARSIVGSIAQQLILGVLGKCEWDILDRELRLPLGPVTIQAILQLLPLLLPSANHNYWVVVDGLDECPTEELDDVLGALQTLREVTGLNLSVCFSARTDSHASSAGERFFKIDHRLSMTDSDRDVEMYNYINTEVKRLNISREKPLCPKTETLVIDQLTLGAQGMYLWVSLQLQAIFPSTSTAITTDEHVLKILSHLPKSLPEAFDQALSRISDSRYGKRIFELVGVAAVPLSGEQLKVALCVTPGKKQWDNSKLPHDSPRQLVASCGGSLIEVDEEDGQVRFIHHSVFSHMAAAPDSSNQIDRGWLYEAECYMGSVCITYLHYPAFDTRIALQGDNVDVNRVAEKVKEAVISTSPNLGHLIRHIRNDRRRKVEADQFDIIKVLQQAGAKEDVSFRSFLPYAQENWFHHTRLFQAGGIGEYELWRAVIEGKSGLVKPPWGESEPELSVLFDFIVKFEHGALFQQVVQNQLCQYHLDSFVGHLSSRLQNGTFRIKGPWLEDSIALLLCAGSVEQQAFQALINLGARGDAVMTSLTSLPRKERGHRLWRILGNLCRDPRTRKSSQETQIFERALEAICTNEFPWSEKRAFCLLEPIRMGWKEGTDSIIRSVAARPSLYLEAFEKLRPLRPAITSGRASSVQDLILNGLSGRKSDQDLSRSLARRAILPREAMLRREIMESYTWKSSGTFVSDELVAAILQPIMPLGVSGVLLPQGGVSPLQTEVNDLPRDRRLRIVIRWAIESRRGDIISRIPGTLYLDNIHDAKTVKFHMYPGGQKVRALICEITNICTSTVSWLSAEGFLLENESSALHVAFSMYSQMDQAQPPNQLQETSPTQGVHGVHETLRVLIDTAMKIDRRIINARDAHGWTALHYAARGRLFIGMRRLLEANADPNLSSEGTARLTPLEVLLSMRPANFVGLDTELHEILGGLASAGAELDRVGPSGLAPLDYAIAIHGIKTVQHLADAGATVSTLSGPSVLVGEEIRERLRIVLFLECALAWVSFSITPLKCLLEEPRGRPLAVEDYLRIRMASPRLTPPPVSMKRIAAEDESWI